MRWLVSVTSLGKSESEPLQIEADTWQGALQLARAGRGDGESLGNLTIAVSEDGCRAVDASSLLSYDVRPLGEDEGAQPAEAASTTSGAPAPLGRPSGMGPPRPSGSGSKRPSATTAASQPPTTGASQPPATRPSEPPLAAPLQPPQTGPAQPPAEVIILKPKVIEAPPPSIPPPSSRPSRPDSSSIPLQVVFKREEERTAAKPITYREYVYVVPANTPDQDVHTLLYHQLELVRSSLDRLPPGKLVNLAVFDAQFQGKPQGAPLATLTWKDWRADAIVYTPRNAAPTNGAGASVTAASEPPGAEPQLAQRAVLPQQPAPAQPAPAAREVPLTEKSPDRRPTPMRDPFAATANAAPPTPPLAPSAPAHGSMAPAPDTKLSVQRRVGGDELVADLFEVMHDLHFLRDALEGGDFCLAVAMEKLPAEAGWVHQYDIDRREFVITSVRGARTDALLLRRHAEREKLLAEAMRGRKALVIEDATDADNLEAASAERFALVGGARSIVVAPVMQAGRFLGAIELVNPLDGLPFTGTDGGAVAYIADQFADFVASRGVVIDEERIAARRPRA
jgi:hypothetical protein